jgi:alpha-1,6-mannosyltransferase
VVAPYTKVEESFNIQAIHDISSYGFPTQNISSTIQTYYDHATFPGAVPRTFVGALALAGVSKPILLLSGGRFAQFIVRAVLGLFNSYALLKYKAALAKVFGTDVGRWYVLLQATQFHVIYYASRTLPNMFAFGLSEFSLSCTYKASVLRLYSDSCSARIPSSEWTSGCSQDTKKTEAGNLLACVCRSGLSF